METINIGKILSDHLVMIARHTNAENELMKGKVFKIWEDIPIIIKNKNS